MKYDYVQICRKIIIDYRLLYLNDLFGIEIIFFMIRVEFATSEFLWTLRSLV